MITGIVDQKAQQPQPIAGSHNGENVKVSDELYRS
jgi:hypothetical protein